MGAQAGNDVGGDPPRIGRRSTSQRGTKDACLAYVDEVWTDMRPLSLRKVMAAAQEGQ